MKNMMRSNRNAVLAGSINFCAQIVQDVSCTGVIVSLFCMNYMQGSKTNKALNSSAVVNNAFVRLSIDA